ncbi:hypothetical protein ABL78_3244 [Leptomonas seymouri]|uniref:Uncharacterized protein n=1 Tax=Leptomonas seymouri TaxID=5684 RepID=A0A0N0P6H4_LEPSE|nr:hypothetical protein ABL78_3244 [Leptomonas seymouri]|eukprot:KPI87646.1 hypothetical protein ABL78_3244 [Leptomonas seymouri]
MQPTRNRFRGSSGGPWSPSAPLGSQNADVLASSRGATQQSAFASTRSQTNEPAPAAIRRRESRGDFTASSLVDEGDAATSGQAGNVGCSGHSSSQPHLFPALSSSVLASLQMDYPVVYAALHVYDKTLRHHKEKFKAKETELLRCIGVGEELLGQIDALKQRCETLAQEREEAVASTGKLTTSEQDGERSAAVAEETRAAARAWDEERRVLMEDAETERLRFREQLQDALQQVSIASAQQRDLEATLHETRAQLYQAKEELSNMEAAYQERESAYAVQRNREMQQQQLLFKQQVAQLQQQADVDKEAVLAEATVELERLQRSLLRMEKEFKEEQRLAGRSTALLVEPSNAATLEIANLRRQIRQLEDANHDLQLQLRRRKYEARLPGGAEEGRLVVVHGNTMDSSALPSGSSNIALHASAAADAHQEQLPWAEDPSAGGAESGAPLQRRLQEENARLRHKLKEVACQAQDDVDKAHEARLELQRQLKSVQAQLQLLRSSVIARLELELQQAREQIGVSEARGRDLQEAADELEIRAIALQKESAEMASQLDAECQAKELLKQELCEAQEGMRAVRQEVEAASMTSSHKDTLIVQLQREKQQLAVALRSLQAQAATIEGALSEMHMGREEETALGEVNTARLQERCVLLQHELEAAQEERLTLSAQLRDAEEAVDVLKDAQRIAQASVRDAQRIAQEVEGRAQADARQFQQQQQMLKSRATEAEQKISRLQHQLAELTQRLRDRQEELMRKDEALRHSMDKGAALTAELRQLREMQSNREEASRERWRQQYSQNTADREQLLTSKERQIEALQQQQQELRQTLTTRDERLEQLQQQCEQTQALLSEAVVGTAAYKGRIQALEEELARAEKERSAAKAELRRLTEKCERVEVTGAATAGQDKSATLRVVELETKLAEYDVKLRNLRRQRQQARHALLPLVSPSSTDAQQVSPLGTRSGCGWDDLVESLHDAANRLAEQNSSELKESPANEGYGNSATEVANVSLLLDACQRAAAAVLQSVRGWVECLHNSDEQRWAALRSTVLTAYAAAENSEESEGLSELRDSPPPSAAVDHKEGLRTAGELRDRAAAAQRSLVAALKDLRAGWASTRAELTIAAQRVEDAQSQVAQLEELKAKASSRDSECAATQTALADACKKYADALHKTASLQDSVDALRQDLAGRTAQSAELEHRLELLTAELQAERAEGVAKWQESQRHREKENAESEEELRELRTRLVTAEEAATAAVDALRKQSEAAQRQLRAQLQDLQQSSTATEEDLRQQVKKLSQEKARAMQDFRGLKMTVVELEERVNATQTAVKAKEAQLATAEKALHEAKRAHHQAVANGAASEAFEQESMANQIASLQLQLRTCREDSALMEETHAVEKAELLALRKVNASLEIRLAEVEEDRAPLRQQLHRLLSSAEK